MGEQMYSSTHF